MNRIFRSTIFRDLLPGIIALLCLGTVTQAANPGAAIEKLIKNCNANGDFDGVVLVAQHGRVICLQAVGPANREWNIPNRADTRFRLCSITKQFTALLVMQQVEAGKLSLDAAVTDYLPEFRRDTGVKITLRHLLSSSSGLPTFDDEAFWRRPDPQLALPAFVATNYLRGDLIFAPGERFNYNNGDFVLLGAVLEKVSGRNFDQLLHEKILEPLGMNHSGLLKQEAVVTNLASGYHRQDDRILNEPFYQIENFSSAGAMYSTADDLLRWDDALLTHKLLGKKYEDEMFTPFPKLGFAALGSWTYELKMPGDRKIKIIERQGDIGGFCVLNLLLPDDGYELIFLSNTDTQTLFKTYASNGLSYEILKTLYAR